MDSGMWVLGLPVLYLIVYAIIIFLIIKLICFIINKTKKINLNNITINYEVNKQDKITTNEKSNLYEIFISIIISIFLLPFVNSINSKFPTAYPGNEASSGEITDYISNQIAIYVWPNNQLVKIKAEFNNLLDSNFISINDLKLNEDTNTINRIEFLIITENVPDNEIDFSNKLISSYNNIKGLLSKYNYDSSTIHFEFTNKNPFVKEGTTHYQNSGYIMVGNYLDSDRNWYHIYVNATPIEIK